MVTCIIIDDEKHARLILLQLIQSFIGGRLKVLDMVPSVAEGVLAIKRHNPDIVFLDIEMPGQNGFDLFSHFEDISFQVVFCTAYEKYAIEAIKVAALDYLLKPVSLDELEILMDRYEKLNVSAKNNRARINTLLNNNNSDPGVFNSIALPVKGGYQMEKIPNIIYCQAKESYCHVHCKSHKNYLVSKSLKQLEELLPNELFFRIHKSYLVNLNYIEAYKKPEGFILLANGEELEVATRRNEEFIQRLTRRS